nr:MAG TPA: hypothetical protein [Caudoviricetes sp.]
MLSIFNIIRGFIWEWFMGNGVSFKDALKHHKSKLIMLVILTISLTLNKVLYDRASLWRDAFRTLETRQKEYKERIELLEESNQKLIAHLGDLPPVENTPETVKEVANKIVEDRNAKREEVLNASDTKRAASEAYGRDPEKTPLPNKRN